jgi:hypothetical protein
LCKGQRWKKEGRQGEGGWRRSREGERKGREEFEEKGGESLDGGSGIPSAGGHGCGTTCREGSLLDKVQEGVMFLGTPFSKKEMLRVLEGRQAALLLKGEGE